jgi:integrase
VSTMPTLPSGCSIQQRSKNGNFRAVVRLASGQRRSQTFKELPSAVSWVVAAHDADERSEPIPDAAMYGAVSGKRSSPAAGAVDVNRLRSDQTRVPTLEEAAARFQSFDESQLRVKKVSGRWILANRSYMKNYILPYFGQFPCRHAIDLMTIENVGSFAEFLAEAPNGRGGTISPQHAGQVIGVLRRLVTFAMGSQWMHHDPTTNVVTPKEPTGQESERMRMNLSLVYVILGSLPTIHWMAVLLQRVTGLRPLEALGLRIKDINLEGRLLWVCEQAGLPGLSNPGDTDNVVANRQSTKGPAGEVRQRWVPIPPMLVPFIRAWILVFHTDPITGTTNQDAFLCDTGQRGYRWMWMTLREEWVKAIEHHGLTEKTTGGIYTASLRSLRYSLGCDGLADGRIPPRFVSDLLGHKYRKKVSPTSLDHYATGQS